jgi:Rod binding domain-containing protein
MLYVNPLGTQDWARVQSSADGASGDNQVREKAVLQELEHLFLFTLLQEMRKTVSIAGESEKSPGSDLYDEMLDDALSGSMASSGQVGVAKQIEEQLRTAGMQHTLKRALEDMNVKPSAFVADKPTEVPRSVVWTRLP